MQYLRIDLERIAAVNNQVGVFAGVYSPDAIGDAEVACGIYCYGFQRLMAIHPVLDRKPGA
jgi:hypothetical protein